MSKYVVSFIPEEYVRDGQALLTWAKCPVFRYCIKDSDTGNVLDDAAGAGYMEPHEALAACEYDSMPVSEKRAVRLQRARVRVWRRSHAALVFRLDRLMRDLSLDAVANGLDTVSMRDAICDVIADFAGELPCCCNMFLMSYLPSCV